MKAPGEDAPAASGRPEGAAAAEGRREGAPAAGTAGTTRAAVLAAPRRLELREVPLPEPGPGQVRVRLEGCGVCGSNLPVWEGRPWFEYPLEPGAPGHEGWGRVDAVGEGVTGLEPGRRVAALSLHAFAEHDLVDAADAVPLPAELDGVPFPGEPLACAMNVFERSDVRPGQKVAVIGIGFLGALLVQLAARAGAEVVALSRRGTALDIALEAGASEAIALDDPHEARERAQALVGGAGFERVIEAVGLQEPLTLAGSLTGVRGRLVIAGYHQDGLREVNLQEWNWRGIDVINAHERDPERYRDGVRRAVEAVRDGRLDPQPLLTHRYPLEEIGSAFRDAERRPEGFLKALVTM